MNKIYIIAEIGINHMGDMNKAKKLIDAASRSGVDAVKFFILWVILVKYTSWRYTINSNTFIC